ncbi:MAG TPA: hypothetical protein VLF93_01865 [Candidatus Saccharimonadales bacterium]|nr:hypothetical protein [Candidatus Saccharimonadales bacterium]
MPERGTIDRLERAAQRARRIRNAAVVGLSSGALGGVAYENVGDTKTQAISSAVAGVSGIGLNYLLDRDEQVERQAVGWVLNTGSLAGGVTCLATGGPREFGITLLSFATGGAIVKVKEIFDRNRDL